MTNSIFSTIFTPVGGIVCDILGAGQTHLLSCTGLFFLSIPMWLVFIASGDTAACYVAAAISGAAQVG